MTAAWIYLLVAGLLEIAGAVNLKLSNGFTRFMPTLRLFFFMGLSLYCLSLSLKEIPIGTAYAIWTGVGAAGTAIYGMLMFQESTAVLRMVCISLILIGVVGLKFYM